VAGGSIRGSDSGVTWRSLLIAFIAIALLAPAGFYIELIVGLAYDFNTQSPPIAPLGIVFLLVTANTLIARRWLGLTRRELLVTYIVVSVSVPLIAHGTMLWFLSCSIGQRAYAQVMPDWQSVFFRYLPPWFAPTDPLAIDGFFQGETSVPWALWRTPLIAWGLFFFSLFVANLSLLLLFGRQWITNERLSFPIAQVPLESIHDKSGSGRFSGAFMFWAGLIGILFLSLLYHLSGIFPSIPAIPLGDYTLVPWLKVGPLAGLGDIMLSLYPWCIGLAYIIPKDLSLSVWVFWWVRVAETVVAIAAGVEPMKPEDYWGTEFPAPYYQGGGAVIALGILAFWAGRHHLARAFRMAFAGRSDGEPSMKVSYRWALIGLAASMSYMTIFCMAAGSRLIVAVALVALILAYHMVWARLRAENGMSFIGFPYTVGSVMTEPLGASLLRPSEIVTIHAVAWTYWPGWGEGCEVITGASLDAIKISDSAHIRQKPLLLAMGAGFVLALVLGMFVVLSGVYRMGFWNLQIWSSWLPVVIRNGGQENHDMIASPSGFNLAASLPLAAGAVVTFLLAALRLRFWWWPLNPVGYLAANVWGTQGWWMPMFVGWLLKSLVIRYGGLRLYQKTLPMAIGIILGDRFVSFIWPLAMALVRRAG